MTGVILQVGISAGGVPNRAIDKAHVTENGITGDAWRHPQFHGTCKRAILIVTAEGIDDLAARGFPVFYGALGENLTTRGLDRRSLRIGQRFRAGEAIVQLTEVRIPCGALNVYGTAVQSAIYNAGVLAGDAASPVWGLSGFYASVIEGGDLRPGDPISLLA
ncbi:MAG TPA: MOSC domain-containing protein [Bryobacteraceae bacterium]|jgi:MOSC domain-containing protein YiiM